MELAAKNGRQDVAELLRKHIPPQTNPSPQIPTQVRVFEKDAGTFAEVKGDLSLAPVLFASAGRLYEKVMQSSRANRITPDDERDIGAAIALLTKLIEVDPVRGSGVPNAMRAAMYFIDAQINKRKDQLDNAEADYRQAIEIGDTDPSNLENWRNSLDQIRTVRAVLGF